MSIEVQGLTKIYQGVSVVDQLSFSAKKGEILGFLGPNGAGKTTTMKMLCCYVPPSSGDAWVQGFNVQTNQNEVKQSVGYLAESNPLYMDMYVKEFLHYMSQLFKITHPQKRINEVIEQTGLGEASHKIIGTLSKGYKQRVGLAQAILHDPEVLILDEPTSGLDVNQLAEIRSLIIELSKDKTVIFSSHIMQEIEALCSRVLLIHKGKKIIEDSMQNLAAKMSGDQVLLLDLELPLKDEKLFGQLKGVKEVVISGNHVRISSDKKEDIRKDVFQLAVKHNLTILEMKREEVHVEEIFKALTNS